jgi:transitional endoplasmic reticulum ATPase
MISRVSGLDQALELARRFQPCVVFAEDIDRAVAGEERSPDIDDVLNTIDGVAAKGSEIITVLTTNHVERINSAMLRPGRLDAVINVEPPDADAARRLIRIYGRALLSADDPLLESGIALDGQIPAVIRECVERSKLVAIGRSEDGAELRITDADVAVAAAGMLAHIDLLGRPQQPEPSGDVFQEMVRRIMDGAIAESGIVAQLHSLDRQVRDLRAKQPAI